MPDPATPERSTLGSMLQAYLDALAAALALPTEERRDVCDEIAGHLIDARSELVETGLSADAASAEALRRLGSPTVLARELTRARQTRRALLAAVGGATWAAGGAAARGLILGLAAVLVVAVAAMPALAEVSRWAGHGGTWSIGDAGWYTACGVAALWVSAGLAARTFVSVAARRSHRPAERIRPWVAAIGGVLVGWLALVWFDAPQNVFSVIALALVPTVFAGAALTASDRPIERPQRARVASLALFAAVVIAVPLLIFTAATPVLTQLSSVEGGPYATVHDLLHATGFDLPGRYVADPPPLGTVTWRLENGQAVASVGGAAALVSRWHNLRLEAWRALPTGGEIDRASTAPFATAPLTVESGALVGTVRVDRTRNVSQWWLVVTGVAADGGRDLIVTLGGANSTFTGSAWDWLNAP